MHPTPLRRALRAAGAGSLVSFVLAVAPAASSAAPFTCSASAVRGTVLGQEVAPVAVGGAGACANQTAGGATGLPAPLSVNAVSAATRVSGTGVDQRAVAAGGIAELKVGLPTLPLTIPVSALPDSLTKISLGTIPLLGPVTVDIKAALQALVPTNTLPSELVSVGALYASAAGRCVSGSPAVDGGSSVTGLKVLGQDLGLDSVVDQVLNLTGGTVDPSNIDLTKVTLPPVLAALPLPQVLGILQSTLKPLLDALPTIQIPAVFTAKVTPGTTTKTATGVTTQAARVQVGLLGQSIADLTIGEAAVGSAGVDCSAPVVKTPEPANAAAEATLQCTSRRVVLTDVRVFGDKVRLEGVANASYVGRTVDLTFDATGRRVARAKVTKAGTFTAVAPLPAKRLRTTNKARYRASIGAQRSLNLKLQRRMVLSSLTSRSGKVTLVGRVTRPLGKPVQTITLTRRVSCRKSAVVKRFKPRANGTFRVTVAAPAGKAAAVYRLATKVRKSTRNRKLFPTFTLPRAVDLN